jgi:hypothetical protein
MAIKKNFTTSNGIELAEAYIRVEHLLIQEKTYLAYRVRVYSNSEAKIQMEEVPFSCAYDISGENPIAQAYSHAKSLPEFSGAKDC